MSVIQHSTSNRVLAETACVYTTALRRDVAAGAIITVLLLAGVAMGGSMAAREEPLLGQSIETSPVEPAQFEYFPSQYVNQGVESFDDLPTF
jgi:hypothetical protein